MLVDTHCHINIMVKKKFSDSPINKSELALAHTIIEQADIAQVSRIINVGTSITESQNCIKIAQHNDHAYAVVGIHPNDLSDNWQKDLQHIKSMLLKKEINKVVGVGECGLDFYPGREGITFEYTDENKRVQSDAFKAQIELALEYDVALVVHSRDAYDETLAHIEPYKNDIKRAVMHCFSYDQAYAQQVTAWNFKLGIGGTVTYPRNEELRAVVRNHPLEDIVLETDAPFLPPQIIRGKKNHPRYIVTIAEYIAQLKQCTLDEVAQKTTDSAYRLFEL